MCIGRKEEIEKGRDGTYQGEEGDKKQSGWVRSVRISGNKSTKKISAKARRKSRGIGNSKVKSQFVCGRSM